MIIKVTLIITIISHTAEAARRGTFGRRCSGMNSSLTQAANDIVTPSASTNHSTLNFGNLMDTFKRSPSEAQVLESQIETVLTQQSFKRLGKLKDNSDAELIEFENGVRAVIKPDGMVDTFNNPLPIGIERVALLVDRRIGLNRVPPTVLRQIDGQTHSVQLFVEGIKESSGTGEPLRMFDYLIGNQDRYPFYPGKEWVQSNPDAKKNLMSYNGTDIAIDNGYRLDVANDVFREIPELDNRALVELREQMRLAEQNAQNAVFRKESARRNYQQIAAEYRAFEEDFINKARTVLWDRETYEGFKRVSEAEWRKILSTDLSPGEMQNFLIHRSRLISHVDELYQTYGNRIWP